jgi:hypothetical protein
MATQSLSVNKNRLRNNIIQRRHSGDLGKRARCIVVVNQTVLVPILQKDVFARSRATILDFFDKRLVYCENLHKKAIKSGYINWNTMIKIKWYIFNILIISDFFLRADWLVFDGLSNRDHLDILTNNKVHVLCCVSVQGFDLEQLFLVGL